MKKMNFEEVLKQDITVSPQVDIAMAEAYSKLKAQKTAPKKQGKKRFRITVAIVAAAVLCASSTIAFAAVNDGMWDNLFGNQTKADLPAKETIQTKLDKEIPVTLPSKSFAAVDAEQAQKLLGKYAMTEPLTVKMGDHTMTINGFVYDKNGGVMSYTLERKGGVTMLKADENSNQAKGAYIDNDSSYHFYVVNGEDYSGEDTYVDWSQSTKERYVCTMYFAWGTPLEEGDKPQLMVSKISMSQNEWTAAGEVDHITSEDSYYDFGNVTTVPVTTAKASNGSVMEVSPFALRFTDTKSVETKEGFDPGDVKRLELKLKDGTSYLVNDLQGNVKNSGYELGAGTGFTVVYNRLIDTKNIDSIVVNDDIVYTLQ